MSARLYSDIKKKNDALAFVKVFPQPFALRTSSMEETNSGAASTQQRKYLTIIDKYTRGALPLTFPGASGQIG